MNEHTSNVLKTPKHKIPIGIPYKTPDGKYMLQLKKHKSSDVEDLSIDSLLSMVISGADKAQQVEGPK